MRQLVAFIVIVSMLVACSTRYKPIGSEFIQYDQTVYDRGLAANKARSVAADRSVIIAAKIQLETLFPDTVHVRVVALASKYNGYVLKAVNTIVIIRIPANNFDSCMADVELLGKVISRHITGQDVTDRYSDHKIRLDNAQKTRERYLALLDRAETIQEVLLLEKELERLNREIELLKGKIHKLEHLVSYATISVDTSEQVKLGPLGYVFNGLYKGIKWLFVRN